MGGGNGCKAKKAQERKAAHAQTGSKAKSQLKSNAKAQNIICQQCKQSFMCTTNEGQMRQHAESRHPTYTAHDCFPDHIPA
ncbi:putative Zinc-binding [Monocercomonoides exilis]|uniref:putative Zinc-binding n=1 Tax=Monocercomonoides exilis TaxID=2049356 RepID=UPI00355AC978|nr:putative Zinc-binding [Monocercomonoides exilis]|eukprot:MONOS_9207.1-p1 / transcript=MONOS_9207.1 / gene=MONOS_9207 / organism=Monocercomonoides_exilis_PA203 / gene_product=unspecified product / transcript_product=unspecified product / location=Mono_scaffold00371:41982-42341(-) / protein_length=80 / sequence_SO=supercontig / SO=protein_coding / is_pseudo=false